MKPVRALRCAIYTRVSTDQGLEQKFNSLDGQREASEAYIKSQAHEAGDACRSILMTAASRAGRWTARRCSGRQPGFHSPHSQRGTSEAHCRDRAWPALARPDHGGRCS